VPDGEDWPDYRHHVLDSLDDLKKTDTAQTSTLQRIETRLAVLEVRVALYAIAASALVTVIAEIVTKVLIK
jgi:hypothetical protein